MLRLPSYLQQNHYGFYYFRICFSRTVQVHFGKREFKKSLQTQNKKLAITLSRAIKIQFDSLSPHEFLQMNWPETKQILNQLVTNILLRFQDDINELGTFGKHITHYPELLAEGEAEKLIDSKSRGLSVNLKDFPALKSYTDDIVQKCRLDDEPAKYERNVTQVAEMLLKLRHRRLEAVKEYYESTPYLFDKVKLQIEKPEKSKQPVDAIQILTGHIQQIVDRDAQVPGDSIYLHELIEKFVAYKLQKEAWNSPRTLKLNQQKLNYILEFYQYIKGENNIRINSLTKTDAQAFESQFRLLPANRTKCYPGKDIGSLLRMSRIGEIPHDQKMSGRTYNSYCDLLSGIFYFAASPKQGYVRDNYFVDLKVKITQKNTYSPFTDNDLTLFFNTPLYTKKEFKPQYAWRYWIPLMMAYGGIRVEEGAQLLLKNIVIKDGVDCLEIKTESDKDTGEVITKVKPSGDGFRYVPIHPTLKELGFFDYLVWLKKNGEDKLFPDLTNVAKNGMFKPAGGKVSRWFNEDSNQDHKKSYLSKCGINEVGKERKVLYSFRHTVQGVLINHLQDIEHDKIDTLFGHALNSMGRKHYGKYSPDTILKIVTLIDFPNAYLPWNTNKNYNTIPFPWDK